VATKPISKGTHAPSRPPDSTDGDCGAAPPGQRRIEARLRKGVPAGVEQAEQGDEHELRPVVRHEQEGGIDGERGESTRTQVTPPPHAPKHPEQEPITEETGAGPRRDAERRRTCIDPCDVDEVEREISVEHIQEEVRGLEHRQPTNDFPPS
jgi:hypothetical protein